MTLADEELATVLTEAYGSPEWTLADVCAARAIESAATAPLLARIAELEAANEEFGKRQEWWNTRMLELERELEDARKDAELLDWMIFYSARVGHDSDGEFCQCIWINEDGEQRTKLFGNAREAIRAAIKDQT